jgi:hypothetical protein
LAVAHCFDNNLFRGILARVMHQALHSELSNISFVDFTFPEFKALKSEIFVRVLVDQFLECNQVLLIRCQRKTCHIRGRRLDIVTFRCEVSGLYLEYLGAFIVDVINLEFILEGDKQVALVELDGL